MTTPRVASGHRPRHGHARSVRRHLVALVALVAITTATLGVGKPASAALTAADARPSTILESPVEPFLALRLAQLPRQPWLPGHRGVDLTASVGDAVASPGPGIVSFVGVVVDRPVVSIKHADGLVTSLEPVIASVAEGDRVGTGQEVGTVAPARGHCAPATCVHWGVRLRGEYVDPLDYLRGFGPIRLLAWNGR